MRLVEVIIGEQSNASVLEIESLTDAFTQTFTRQRLGWSAQVFESFLMANIFPVNWHRDRHLIYVR